jgi:hypothetical protein
MERGCPTLESRLLTGQVGAEPGECWRQLGRVYRLILSYEPQKQAIAQGAIGETAPPTDNTLPAVG